MSIEGGPGLSDTWYQALCRSIAAVPDPEVPALTIEDLGVLRSIDREGNTVVVTITPTYSGCPAMHYIEDQLGQLLAEAGVEGEVRTVLRPAWTTAWMSEEGRTKLAAFGIAPPQRTMNDGEDVAVAIRRAVECPRCGSKRTEAISEFGSTACKALYRCRQCLEPFDYFKEL